MHSVSHKICARFVAPWWLNKKFLSNTCVASVPGKNYTGGHE